MTRRCRDSTIGLTDVASVLGKGFLPEPRLCHALHSMIWADGFGLWANSTQCISKPVQTLLLTELPSC